jgi:rfaE bifunctional protein kinase chain/domain
VSPGQFEKITGRYPQLRVAVVGDFCLDRYLEIDPAKAETSIETGLPVYNVTRVRSQPGAAGTILNNLVALGAGTLYPVGFAGEDGEGYELLRCLRNMAGVKTDFFRQTSQRRTFTYCKPLVLEKGQSPRELNRLDSKNWTPTPVELADQIASAVREVTQRVDAMIVMDQVDLADTGAITRPVIEAVKDANTRGVLVLADSRQGLANFPPVTFKMNATELGRMSGRPSPLGRSELLEQAAALAKKNGRAVFITLAEEGIIGAAPGQPAEHLPALPLRGEIDIVGAGDAVTANLTCALAARASIREALELANAAASIVIHQLGTTGTASVPQLKSVIGP